MSSTILSNQPIILVVDDLIPSCAGSSGDKDLLNLFAALSELPFRIIFAHTKYHANENYQRDCQEKLCPEYVGDVVALTNWDELKGLISQCGSLIEFVWIRRASNFKAFHRLREDTEWSPKLIIDFVDLHFLRFKRSAHYLDPCQDWLSMAMQSFDAELFALSGCDVAVCISCFEESILRRLAPNKQIHFVPIARDSVELSLDLVADEKEYVTLGFIGSFEHSPNLVSINHFIASVFPELAARFHGLKLLVAGKGSSPHRVNSAVSCLGELPSVDEFYSKIDIAIAPLLFGAGQKGKVVEALAYGKPVIASSVAAEGFEDPILDLLHVADRLDEYVESLEFLGCSKSESSPIPSLSGVAKLLDPGRFKLLTQEVILNLMRRGVAEPCSPLEKKFDLSCGYVRRVGVPGSSLSPMYSIVSGSDYISNCLVREGFFDAYLNNLIRIFGFDLPAGSLVLDVGANVGSFSIPMALIRPDVEVMAFEPQLIPYCQLCSSLIDNSARNLNPLRVAIGDGIGSSADLTPNIIKIPVSNHLNSINLGGFSLDQDVLDWKRQIGEVDVEDNAFHSVQLFSLDQLRSCGMIARQVSMIKIDVEGLEIAALKGAKQLIENDMPILIYEGWSRDYAPQFEGRVKEVDSYVSGLGYRIASFGELRVAVAKLI